MRESRSRNISFPMYDREEREAIAPLTCSGLTSR